MPTRLVKVTSRLSLWEAELAQARLASGGISAYLGNAHLVLWGWHYRDATGGVTVHVVDSDAETAREILDSGRPEPGDGQPAWTCPTCGQRVEASWAICSSCGRLADGTHPSAATCQEAAQGLPQRVEPRSRYGTTAIAAMAIIGWLISTGDVFMGMLVWTVLAVSVLMYRATAGEGGEAPRPEEAHVVEPEPVDDPAWQSLQRRRRMGDSIALRAWQASVLGFFMVLPLLLYSGWLLFRLNLRKTPVGRRGLRRWVGAFCMTVVGVALFGMMFLFLMVAGLDGLYYEAAVFVVHYLDLAGGVFPWP